MEVMKVNRAAPTRAGVSTGSVTRRKVRVREAPREREASRRDSSMRFSAAETKR